MLSVKADRDVVQIIRDSMAQWGMGHAEQYVLGLHRTFQNLADFPDLGRDASRIRPGYRRLESMSHVVFYRPTDSGVSIVRVLHKRMDVDRHL